MTDEELSKIKNDLDMMGTITGRQARLLLAEVERLHEGLLQAHEVLWNGREPGRDRRSAYDQAQAILHGLLYPETALPPTQ